jgi:hypothetical protein
MPFEKTCILSPCNDWHCNAEESDPKFKDLARIPVVHLRRIFQLLEKPVPNSKARKRMNVCASCLEKVENQVENEESQTLSSDDDDSSSIPEEIGLAGTSQPDSSAFSCIEDIDLSSLSPDQLATLAHRLGSSIKQQVAEDSLKHQERYADPESLSDFNLDEYSKSQNEVLSG